MLPQFSNHKLLTGGRTGNRRGGGGDVPVPPALELFVVDRYGLDRGRGVIVGVSAVALVVERGKRCRRRFALCGEGGSAWRLEELGEARDDEQEWTVDSKSSKCLFALETHAAPSFISPSCVHVLFLFISISPLLDVPCLALCLSSTSVLGWLLLPPSFSRNTNPQASVKFSCVYLLVRGGAW